MLNKIYHHYNRDADIEENHTTLQKQQQTAFIDKVANELIMKKLKDFLFCKGKLSVRFTVVVVHWQKLRDCFLKASLR